MPAKSDKETNEYSEGESLILKHYPDAIYERKHTDKKTGVINKVKCIQHFGLVGAAHMYKGGIKKWHNDMIQIAAADNQNKAVFICALTFKDDTYFSAFGVASPGNTAPMVQPYVDSMAETRAEVRCLRKALNVTKFVGDEELDDFGNEELQKFVEEAEGRVQEVHINNGSETKMDWPEGWNAPSSPPERVKIFNDIMALPDGVKLMTAILNHHNVSSPEYLKTEKFKDAWDRIQKKKEAVNA